MDDQKSEHHYDIVVVGAGISGINAGYRIQTTLPTSTYTILENRDNVGGTWDLFKYPGIRSDSDLHTFGFEFNPWKKPNPIATGESIVDYINATAKKFGIDEKIQFRHKVVSANWSSDAQRWRLEVENEGIRKVYHAKFVIMGTGYYNYEKPLEARIPGIERFKGQTVHPQFWPQDLDFKGKKMVIIGSGATAITILPAVVDNGVGKVTMLQRSPSYVMSVPQKKPGEKNWYDYLPRWIALRIVRIQFILVPWLLYLFCRKYPIQAANFIRKAAKKQLPKDIPIDPHFKPAYKPWDQRLCLCPDGDFFKAFESGRAEIVTDTISTVTEDGIELSSGERLDADIIVTATGLSLQICGGIPITVDNEPVDVPNRFLWRATMLSGVPNLGVIIGYVNASWTLGADTASRLLTRLYKFMQDNQYTSAVPRITEEEAKDPQVPLALNSTYVNAARNLLPHAGRSGPWLPRDNYFRDSWNAGRADLREGMMFGRVST
ncbi:FAD/NAD(P)-binding domain-containing protein [Sporormia fimetaria CBS 119925]|uniref:FAD/NAD(P)-binding domain-containing protein n=1 Tax=Sporormia fimetaria CBS 119925 TaxID=1340428 RepID=A0A6A6UY49_9PLEO|nr:FAD/NAD(P)-binding domain-containing protein [Sporormia fimetaria CBS 119925]